MPEQFDILGLALYGVRVRYKCTFYICGSMHHQFILLSNQRDAALSRHISSSLRGYSTCFGCFLHPSSGVQLKLDAVIGTVHVSVWCGLNPLKDVQGQESISLCHGHDIVK
jgi:hypothetical protein